MTTADQNDYQSLSREELIERLRELEERIARYEQEVGHGALPGQPGGREEAALDESDAGFAIEPNQPWPEPGGRFEA